MLWSLKKTEIMRTVIRTPLPAPPALRDSSPAPKTGSYHRRRGDQIDTNQTRGSRSKVYGGRDRGNRAEIM